MPHRPSRARRAGYTLALLPLVLASASGAPAHGTAASAAQPAHTAHAKSAATSSLAPTSILIPCISGTCEVPVRGTPAPVPLKPAPPSSVNSAPETLAAR
jgi:hypothetical protein